MDDLYPVPERRTVSELDVTGGHTLVLEEAGNPDGKPVLVVHGGPGGGSSPTHYRFFDPAAYRVVLVDQRGAGRSRPHASVEHNTTWDLVDDFERVREHLGIDRWMLFGGSWGSALSLAYAQTHPERVTEMVLRGIFLLRAEEIAHFYQDGASRFFPDAWEDFVAPIPEEERHDLVAAYHRRLFSEDREEMLAAARAWSRWERATCMHDPMVDLTEPDAQVEAFARIENHYFVNGGFFAHERQLLDGVEVVRHIPTVVVQGRYDVICPMTTAWDLHREWPEAELVVNTGAGHSMFDPENARALRAACDRFRP